ncbi:SPTN2 protein, partial [Onychorhynchus coronatus]|nr:SPTN2 protein [Onychorhynchus coronatus]
PQVRLRSRDLGTHLAQVDELLQLHALLEGDVAAQAERVRGLGAQAERFLGEGGGYQPCPPEQLRGRVAALERRYRELSALSGQRRLRLERSRRLWKFLWDAGEEEAWLREQERLLRCPELGRDLAGSLRMLSQLEAIRGALGGRAAPLRQLLERGRELLALGSPEAAGAADGAAGSGGTVEPDAGSVGSRPVGPTGSTAGAAGSTEPVELAPGSAGSATGAVGSTEPVELVPGSIGSPAGAAGSAEPMEPGEPDVEPGLAARLEELQRRHRELEARAESRRLELREVLALLAARSEADACALWVGEREQWLLSMEIPERIEDLEVVQQRFETLEPELAALGARVAAVGRAAEELQGSGERTRESARDTWEQLRDRWGSFQAGMGSPGWDGLSRLGWALQVGMGSPGRDGFSRPGWVLQAGMGSPGWDGLSRLGWALQAGMGSPGWDGLSRPGWALQAGMGSPGRDGFSTQSGALRVLPCSARRLQAFLRDLAALQAWLSRARAAAGSEDVPASLAEAEGSLRQHESLGTEISHYGADYRSARAAGRELSQGRTDPQSLSLLQRLDALDADWEELGQTWEKRRQLLAQAVAFHVFLRDAKQLEGTLGKQEHALALTELPGTVPGAEAAVRRLEEALAAVEAGAERVRGLCDTGRRLLAEGGVHAEKVRETVESVERRHQKNRESAQELLGRLRDNWELQKFLQDAQELTLWLNEKLPVARDVSYEGARDLQGKWQKHQAFVAELAANRGWLEALEKEGQQLAGSRPSLGAQVAVPLGALRALWAQVEAAAGAKGRGLAEAARAEGCAQACAGLR